MPVRYVCDSICSFSLLFPEIKDILLKLFLSFFSTFFFFYKFPHLQSDMDSKHKVTIWQATFFKLSNKSLLSFKLWLSAFDGENVFFHGTFPNSKCARSLHLHSGFAHAY